MLDCCGTIWSIKHIALLERHYIFTIHLIISVYLKEQCIKEKEK